MSHQPYSFYTRRLGASSAHPLGDASQLPSVRTKHHRAIHQDAERTPSGFDERSEVKGNDATKAAEKNPHEEFPFDKVLKKNGGVRSYPHQSKTTSDIEASALDKRRRQRLQPRESGNPRATRSKKAAAKVIPRLDLNDPNLDDPVALAAIEKMKIQIQALYPESRKVHPKHKKCPVCQKHFYNRSALLSHMEHKWKCRRLLPKQFAELIEVE